jgi:hyperosmotically inducible protein
VKRSNNEGFQEALAKEAHMRSTPLPYFRVLLMAGGFVVVGSSLHAASAPQQNAQQRKTYSPKAQERIIRETRHALLMLPRYGGPFDHIAFRLKGYDVILTGQVTNAVLKPDAERAVKNIEGVERVDNKIETLPPSPGDDRLRRALFQSINGFGPLQRYSMPPHKPIQILVRNGNVVLEGIVANEADKNMAGIRANVVPGIFSVTNNLRVEKGASK